MTERKHYSWCIIGAGPAGIAAVGKLLDHNIDAKDIAWIDPRFKVGDLGDKWYNVSSNTKVHLFTKFLEDSPSFKFDIKDTSFKLNTLDPQDHCLLKEVRDPLQWVSDHLKEKVHHYKDEALGLNLVNSSWEIKLKKGSLSAKKVILATGSDPKVLSHGDQEVIPLEVALNPEKLEKVITPKDTVAVFGASHSGVLILENLLNLKPKAVYNFYRSPHLYAMQLDGWILYDNTGLKGRAAKWAKKHLDGELPKTLKRHCILENTCKEELALCNKVVYAIGFSRKPTPVVETYPYGGYQETTGIIAPNLFGYGIAYPQMHYDRFGNKEYRVGLWKFMEYLNQMLPIWLKY